jgi:HK97 family phage portal protein
VVQLWPLRPDWLSPIRDAKRFMVAYEYTVPGMNPVRIDARDVLEVKLWDPLDLYSALAPVTVASRVAAVDNSATDFIKLTFEHGGVPMGVLSSKQNLTETQVESIRTRWRQRYGGFKNWADPAVLDADASYQRAGLTFAELGFEILDARAEARICAVLDVPPILVGAKVGLDRSTYSNYAEARTAFWQDGQLPRLKRIADEINTDLAPEFGVGIEVDWDLSGVPALQEDAAIVWQRAGQAYQWGGITLNEYRAMMGLEEVPGGDDFKAPAPSPFAQPQDGEEEEDAPPEGEEPEDEEERGAKALAKALSDAPDNAERRRHEHALQDDMEGFFAGEIERLREAWRGGGDGNQA